MLQKPSSTRHPPQKTQPSRLLAFSRQLSLSLLLACGLAPAAHAQSPSSTPANERSRFVPVDKWDLNPNLKELNQSLSKFTPLIKVLNKANKELAGAFEDYSKDPKSELLASRVELKLARYAAGLDKEFQAISATQDILLSNLRGLNHKLGHMTHGIGGHSKGFEQSLKQHSLAARKHRKQLIEIAQRIKNDPPADKQQLQQLKLLFAKTFRRYRLDLRYQRGYRSRLKGYGRLTQYVSKLKGLFANLEGDFQVLAENIGNERKFLREAIQLQLDGIKMKKLMSKNIRGGKNALIKVTQKLQELYQKVDNFTKVHDKVNASLDNYTSGRSDWDDFVKRIGPGAFGQKQNADLDKLIDSFANQDTDNDEQSDEDLLKEILRESKKDKKQK